MTHIDPMHGLPTELAREAAAIREAAELSKRLDAAAQTDAAREAERAELLPRYVGPATCAELACDYCGGTSDAVILPTADYPVASPRCAAHVDTFGDVVRIGDPAAATAVVAAARAVDDGRLPDEMRRNARVAIALQSSAVLDVPAEPVPAADVEDVDPDAELAADADTLIVGARDHGGASIPLAEHAEHGYYVGLPGRGIVFDTLDDVDPAAVAAWLYSVGHVDVVAAAGSWVDDETGRVYFDASSHHAELGAAVNACQNRGELALWDIGAAREIRADGTVAAADVVPGDVIGDTSTGAPVHIIPAAGTRILDDGRIAWSGTIVEPSTRIRLSF